MCALRRLSRSRVYFLIPRYCEPKARGSLRNLLELVRGEGAKRQVWLPEPNEVIDEKVRRARITYSFAGERQSRRLDDGVPHAGADGRVERAVPVQGCAAAVIES
jgi:hypothetical protein